MSFSPLDSASASSLSRRRVLLGMGAGLTGANFLLARRAGAGLFVPRIASQESHAPHTPAPAAHQPSPDITPQGYRPVITPNGTSLPYELDGDVKVFRLTAEPLRREFIRGVTVNCWGYNGSTPGPTIEAVEGDRVRIFVTNNLPEPTSVHWHGIFLPNGMDGVSGLTQRAIQPGETFMYEFTLRQHGTYFYHPHYDEMVQYAMGMMGMLIIHPREPEENPPDRDFCIFLHEWALHPGTATPDPIEMLDFNYFTFNGKVWPATDPLVASLGQRVRIRLANISMDTHPIHLHGFSWHVIHTEGGVIQPSARWIGNTVEVPPGGSRAMDFIADAEGDWPMHCHKIHHAMIGMVHGLPIMTGADTRAVDERIARLIPGYASMGQTGMGGMSHAGGVDNYVGMGGGDGPFGRIEMSGMFTILKVRAGLSSFEDPGWYQHPEGTVAGPVNGKDPAMQIHTCPMHPEILSQGPGICPKCKMDLRPKKE